MSQLEPVLEQVQRLFSERLNLDVPSVDADLIETGMLDSLTFVSLLHELELRFQVRFSMEDLDMERFRSIRRIAELMAERVTSP
jgi:acyl carrier protein